MVYVRCCNYQTKLWRTAASLAWKEACLMSCCVNVTDRVSMGDNTLASSICLSTISSLTFESSSAGGLLAKVDSLVAKASDW